MDVDPVTYFIAEAYGAITAISQRERVEKADPGKKGSITVIRLPTLEKIDLWMRLNDWNTSPVNEDEFLDLITLFHVSYLGALL